MSVRGIGRVLTAPLWWLVRARLRTKLALSLLVAALLPMLIVASRASGVVLGTLERGLDDRIDRHLDVALKLTFRAVERLGDDAVQLASDGGLADALNGGDVAKRLRRSASHMPSALIQVLDREGRELASLVTSGDRARFAAVKIAPARFAELTKARSGRVVLELSPAGVVARAMAPVIGADGDPARSPGAVVLSMPLDGDFAETIKEAIGADVLVGGLETGVVTTTIRDAGGNRLDAVPVPDKVRRSVQARRRPSSTSTLAGRERALAWAALDVDGGPALGLLGVAIDRGSLSRAQAVAFRSLAIGAAVVLVLSLTLAAFMARWLGRPIAKLHRGAIAVARGDLDYRIDVDAGDEIGDLAQAFTQMTQALKDNQQHLAARMREMVELQAAGRAMASVIDLAQVSAKIVEAVARVFDARVSGLFLVGSGTDSAELRLSLACARLGRDGDAGDIVGRDAEAVAAPFESIAAQVAFSREPVAVDDLAASSLPNEAMLAAGIDGAALATPLERQSAIVGVLVIARSAGQEAFTDADANLLAAFADQAATAIENARLYEQIRDSSGELEAKVRQRTAELTAMNFEAGRVNAELREAQARMVLSERMAGLGQLVAGVAHEINSPSGAIRGAVDTMIASIALVAEPMRQVSYFIDDPNQRESLFQAIDKLAKEISLRQMPTGPGVRRAGRELRNRLEPILGDAAIVLSRRLAECGADEASVLELLGKVPDRARVAVLTYLVEHTDLHRTAFVIRKSITKIQKIVGALKTYSHLDEEPARVDSDIHEGIETTLVLFAHALSDILVVRRFETLPPVPIFVDELNQVWTNLIQNAVQALGGKGSIAIETERSPRHGDGVPGVAVRVIDDGPGIPPEIQSRIFDPFFTTKPKGEGTGLGLGIVAAIVAKHGGEVACASEPGRTVFEVWLPVEAPESAGGPVS